MINKHLALALAAGVTATGAVLTSAATLGGLTSEDLGADTSMVASCDEDGVAADFTTAYDATEGAYVVTAVKLTGVATACDDQDVEITLADSTGAELGSGTLTDLDTSAAVSVSVAGPSSAEVVAEDVTDIAVVISG